MATREKTIMYSFPMTTVLVNDATVTNLPQITIHIPEASPTFTSVYVEIGFQDVITSLGGLINEHRCGFSLGGGPYTTITETDSINSTNENIAGVVGPFNFTSQFTTYWTGTSMTADCQVYFDQSTGTTLGMANVTAVLYITYTYDDDTTTNPTQIKSVFIPFDSLQSTLPTSASNFGTDQIPQLTGVGGMLPEETITIRDYYFLIEGNENNNGSSLDWTISANIDGGATTSFMQQECALGSDRFCRWIYKPAVPDTTTSHNLQLWATQARAQNLTVTLVVTYEFDAATTTRVLNCVLLPFELLSPLGRTTSADQSRFSRTFQIQDPGTITLQQSAFRLNWNSNVSITAIWARAGAQVFRNYTNFSNVVAGMFSLQHRIDASAADGVAGITLARGQNEIVIDAYTTNGGTEATNLNGMVYINYHSDIGAGGIGQNSHFVIKRMLNWNALLTDLNTIANFAFPIAESNYWILSVGVCFFQWIATSSMGIILTAQRKTGEGKGTGYVDIYADGYVSDSERSCSIIWMRGRDVFRRFPADLDPDRIDVETARDYRLYTTSASANGLLFLVSYHSFTYTISGNITGNDDTLPTTVKCVHNESGEVISETELNAGVTSYAFTVYDNTDQYYVDAYQNNTLTGRSGLGTAT